MILQVVCPSCASEGLVPLPQAGQARLCARHRAGGCLEPIEPTAVPPESHLRGWAWWLAMATLFLAAGWAVGWLAAEIGRLW